MQKQTHNQYSSMEISSQSSTNPTSALVASHSSWMVITTTQEKVGIFYTNRKFIDL